MQPQKNKVSFQKKVRENADMRLVYDKKPLTHIKGMVRSAKLLKKFPYRRGTKTLF